MNGMRGSADPSDRILVTEAGGFIGGRLVAALRAQGFENVRAIGIKLLDRWYRRFDEEHGH